LKKFIILFIFVISFGKISGDENINALCEKFPSILTNYATLGKSEMGKKAVWSRTDLMAPIFPSQFEAKANQYYLKNIPVNFLSPQNSLVEFEKLNDSKEKLPMVIYKWEIEVEKTDEFIITINGDLGTFGFLNNEPVTQISNGIISLKGSGKQWTQLKNGKNILCLIVKPKVSNSIKIISKKDADSIKEVLIKKLPSKTQADTTWLLNDFIPFLGTLKNGVAPFIITEIKRIHQVKPFEKNSTSGSQLLALLPQTNSEAYKIEKYFFEKYPELYFYLPTKDDSSFLQNNFLLSNSKPRQNLLQQLIFDGQVSLAEKYFELYLEAINSHPTLENKSKTIEALYSTRFVSLFRIGRITDANEILKKTQEICTPFPIPRYFDGKPNTENLITLTQSFDETTAYQIRQSFENYDGTPDQLVGLYKTFFGLKNNLVKNKEGAISLNYLFSTLKNSNEKLKNEFELYCQEKVKPRIEKILISRNVKLAEELIEQFGSITALPEIHILLVEEYFNNGLFLKALSHAQFLFQKHPELASKFISKLVLLEEISNLPSDQRVMISKEILNSEIKLKGKLTTLENLKTTETSPHSKKSLGKFLKSFPLEKPHIQYWNHSLIDEYQPIEPLFTQNNIIFNGGSYLINYSIKQNEISWQTQPETEYKKETENGPHQKRFITRHAGDQLIVFTNRNLSNKKTIKSFDLNGTLLWDFSDQKTSLTEEPICTPIESHGKLFGLSYSNRETINTVSFSVYETNTGKEIAKTPISYLNGSIRDMNYHNVGSGWNSFTHDDHFTKDQNFIYGYTGTGIVFKADGNSGALLWEKGYSRSHNAVENGYWNYYGFAPSGFIHLFEDTLISFTPDIQIFTAVDKNTGEPKWKSNFHKPKFIHNRGKSDFIYFSDNDKTSEPVLYKVNPHNGEIIWQTTTFGLGISGEGDWIGDKLFIPSDKSTLEFDAITGKLIQVIPLQIQPIKIRCSQDHIVLLTTNAAFLFKNDNTTNSNDCKPIDENVIGAKYFEPDQNPSTISFENINLETTLKIPEAFYTSSNLWKTTRLTKTSKPYHFLLSCQENLTLFREGYSQKNGLYIPPAILWFGQYTCYDIYEDILYVSEYGKLTAFHLFTREKLWSHTYERFKPINPNNMPPQIAVTNQYIALQTENNSIRILDRNTKSTITEFYCSPFKIMKMEGNYIVTTMGIHNARCYDISQNGKEIWSVGYNHYNDIFIKDGYLIFEKKNNNLLCFYELKTGILKQQYNTSSNDGYSMALLKLDDAIISFGKTLFDRNTAKPLEKYQTGKAVAGGGFIGFFKALGQEGNYIDNGKEYAFKTKGHFTENNYFYCATRKDNRIVLFSFYFVETFEIAADRLESIDFASITAGKYGNHNDQAYMDLFPLDNSLLEIRKDEMYFYRNFDLEQNYEKINSFRVENKRNSNWPFSELYPETELNDSNWISYNAQKSKQTLSYQAFSDENYAYLRFKLSPNDNKDFKNILYLSVDGIQGKILMEWDIKNWNQAQCSFNIKDNLETWKEIDYRGYTSLYIKIKLAGTFHDIFKETLPNFNIEFRQMSEGNHIGVYRIGGAYQGIVNQIPWLNYRNDESQSFRNFSLRTTLYENKINFFPLGDDLVNWLKDRRKLRSSEDNIATLKNMLALNVKSYCSVNILTALLVEEIQLLKSKNKKEFEFSDEFSTRINNIIKNLTQLALEKGMNQEWVNFALSFWTIEVFPYKFCYAGNNKLYSKPFYSTAITVGRKSVINNDYTNKASFISPNINQPFIEWIFPGLIPDFPQGLDLNVVSIGAFVSQKNGLGKIMAYTPTSILEICNRNGKFINETYNITKSDASSLTMKSNFYYFNNRKYDCFQILSAAPLINIDITVPNIKTPNILKDTAQTPESILLTLENLPSDNENGLMLIENYLKLKENPDNTELIKIYGKWLNSVRESLPACLKTLQNIYEKNQSRKDIFEFIENIVKDAKISPRALRKLNLIKQNAFLNKSSRSVIGPLFEEIKPNPEVKLSLTQEYKSDKSTFLFKENLDSKKGGSIYIVSQITSKENEKAFLYISATNDYNTLYTLSSFSVWLNGNALAQDEIFFNHDDNIFQQKIMLNKGQNILLIKINGIDGHAWGKNISFCIGNIYGSSINGVALKPLQ
jgi:hypothetical protein